MVIQVYLELNNTGGTLPRLSQLGSFPDIGSQTTALLKALTIFTKRPGKEILTTKPAQVSEV